MRILISTPASSEQNGTLVRVNGVRAVSANPSACSGRSCSPVLSSSSVRGGFTRRPDICRNCCVFLNWSFVVVVAFNKIKVKPQKSHNTGGCVSKLPDCLSSCMEKLTFKMNLPLGWERGLHLSSRRSLLTQRLFHIQQIC